MDLHGITTMKLLHADELREQMSSHLRVAGVLAIAVAGSRPLAQQAARDPGLEVFARAAGLDEREAGAALAELTKRWRAAYAAMVLDLAEFSRPSRAALPETARFPSRRDEPDRVVERPLDGIADSEPVERAWSPVRDRLLRFLGQQTGKGFGHDFERRYPFALQPLGNVAHALAPLSAHGLETGQQCR